MIKNFSLFTNLNLFNHANYNYFVTRCYSFLVLTFDRSDKIFYCLSRRIMWTKRKSL